MIKCPFICCALNEQRLCGNSESFKPCGVVPFKFKPEQCYGKDCKFCDIKIKSDEKKEGKVNGHKFIGFQCMRTAAVYREEVTILITGGEKSDWYHELKGKMMKVIIDVEDRDAKSIAIKGQRIKDGDFKVIKGKDIRRKK